MTSLSFPLNRQTPLLNQLLAALIGGLLIFLGFTIFWTIGFQLIYAGRIFPGVSVAGIDLSGMSPNDAALKLNQALSYPITGKILFQDGERLWVASPAELGLVFDPSASALSAYDLGRQGGLFGALAGQVRARAEGADVSPVVILDERVAYTYLQNIASQLDQPVVEASLRLEGTNVFAQSGQVGRLVNIEATLIDLGAQLQSFRDAQVPLVIQEVQPVILDVTPQAEIARRMLSQPLILTLPNAAAGDPGPWVYNIEVLANMLGVTLVEKNGQTEVSVGLDPETLRQLLSDLQPSVDRLPANARFYFDDPSAQLVLVESATVGRTMDMEASLNAINESLARGEHTISLVINEQQPAVNDNATAAELGITEKIAEYTSYFRGSAPERVQNIKAAADQFYGVLVAPGATFSMGDTLGDVSLDNGYAEALIIYGGRTIKGVGGGVCQVSTTLFRTVFNAGYPVVERNPHAYRVSYYEQTASGRDTNLAGLDATVYFPLVDFKFINDTSYWLLMETYAYESSLTWKFYSTPDGRTVEWDTTGPRNVVPAPDPLFEVDPELEEGQIKQVDWSAEGADVTVNRTVYRAGQVYFSDSYETHYEAWQAVCQYGRGTENPEKSAKKQGKCLPPS